MTDLSKLAEMPHLSDAGDSIEEQKAKVIERHIDAKKKAESKYDSDPYTFAFSWESPNGEQFKGSFTTKILSIKDRRQVALLRASMAANMKLDALAEELVFIQTHLSLCLTERPNWATDEALENCKYPALLQAIFEEVIAHENWFLGYRESTPEG